MAERKKKVDYEALTSPFMRIPRMKTEVARDLLDLGLHEIYELEGRSPEVLFEELKKSKGQAPDDRLAWFRLAVYFAENSQPEASLLHPLAWSD